MPKVSNINPRGSRLTSYNVFQKENTGKLLSVVNGTELTSGSVLALVKGLKGECVARKYKEKWDALGLEEKAQYSKTREALVNADYAPLSERQLARAYELELNTITKSMEVSNT